MHASLFDGYCPQLLQRPVAAAGSQSVKWGSLVTSVRHQFSHAAAVMKTSCANAKRHVQVWWLSCHARKEASLIMDLVGSARYCSQSHPFVPPPFVPHHCVILIFRLQVLCTFVYAFIMFHAIQFTCHCYPRALHVLFMTLCSACDCHTLFMCPPCVCLCSPWLLHDLCRCSLCALCAWALHALGMFVLSA